MQDIKQRLKQKSINANKSEYFVFLPNNLTDINSISATNANPIFRDAIAAKNEGNSSFENNQYDEAIRHYDRAIHIFEEMNTSYCATALSVCYQNRSTANASNGNYVQAISDASKAIELNEHYAKAYYRRAMCYYEQKKFYRALQDIMQACVLERFKNKLYINAAVDIVGEIDKDHPIIQWKKAYIEMDAESLVCDHCWKQHMLFVRNCGIFDPLCVSIPDNAENQPLTGYIRAMVGIKELNSDEVLAGCNEEIASKGAYSAQSYIVKAYMNSVVIQSPITLIEDLNQDMMKMNDLISAPNVPENIKHQAKFCRANLYNRKGLFTEAKHDLESLKDLYGNTGLFHLIKSGALFQFALSKIQFLRSLVDCSAVLPNVYELQFQVVQAKSNYISDPHACAAFMIGSLEELIERFPSELTPRILLIGFFIELDVKKATQTLQQARKDFPNRLDEMISLYGLLKPNHPSCVNYFKRAIRAHKDDPNSFEGLLNYFGSTTYEYAKAIEVSTKALFNFLKEEDFQEMWEHRQHLLKRIIDQHFWGKL